MSKINSGQIREVRSGRAVRATCGLCQTTAELELDSPWPGPVLRAAGWQLWRAHGWCCPFCSHFVTIAEQGAAS